MSFNSFILTCLIAAFSVTYNHCSGEVIPGTKVEIVTENDPYRFVVVISYKDDKLSRAARRLCNGVLVSKRHALTTSFCAHNRKKEELVVYAQSSSLSACDEFDVDDIKTVDESVHDDLLMHADLTMLRLAKTVEGPNDMIARIAAFPRHKLYGLDAVMAGWGLANDTAHADAMEKVSVKILTENECESRYKELHEDKAMGINANTTLCSVTDDDAFGPEYCQTVGGPLLDMNKVLIGIVNSPCRTNRFKSWKNKIFLPHRLIHPFISSIEHILALDNLIPNFKYN